MTDTNHTDSFETKNAAIQLTATLDREVFKGQYSSSGLEAIEVVVARELATLQAHTSQQVEEAVRKRIIEIMCSSGFTIGYYDKGVFVEYPMYEAVEIALNYPPKKDVHELQP